MLYDWNGSVTLGATAKKRKFSVRILCRNEMKLQNVERKLRIDLEVEVESEDKGRVDAVT